MKFSIISTTKILVIINKCVVPSKSRSMSKCTLGFDWKLNQVMSLLVIIVVNGTFQFAWEIIIAFM